LEVLNALDTWLFIFLNITIANPVFDILMPLITNKWTWVPVWFILVVILMWKGGRQGRWVVLLAVISVAGADMISYRVLKKNIQRERPCNVIEQTHLTVKRSGSYSMPSNHAANFFALAAVFSFFYRDHKKWFYSIAGLVSFSRVSVGVHYPFDIIIGALVGYMIAWLTIFIYKKINLKYSTG
jgi:undecaprenyl-diphosphatase